MTNLIKVMEEKNIDKNLMIYGEVIDASKLAAFFYQNEESFNPYFRAIKKLNQTILLAMNAEYNFSSSELELSFDQKVTNVQNTSLFCGREIIRLHVQANKSGLGFLKTKVNKASVKECYALALGLDDMINLLGIKYNNI